VQLGDELIAQQELVALQDVAEGSLWRRIIDAALLYFE